MALRYSFSLDESSKFVALVTVVALVSVVAVIAFVDTSLVYCMERGGALAKKDQSVEKVPEKNSSLVASVVFFE